MVRIFESSRRPCDSEALATSSYDTNLAQPFSAATFVSAAVKVVLPWSMCPMVPTFTCGLLRSNFSLAMSSTSSRLLNDFRYALAVHLRALRYGGQPPRVDWLANRSSLAYQASGGWSR